MTSPDHAPNPDTPVRVGDHEPHHQRLRAGVVLAAALALLSILIGGQAAVVIAQGEHVGPQGERGPAGESIVGPRGRPGADSTVPGPRGEPGKDGRDGRDGKDGLGLNWRGTYDPDATYQLNDLVRHDGCVWIALATTDTQPADDNLWDRFTCDGSDGQDYTPAPPPSEPTASGLALTARTVDDNTLYVRVTNTDDGSTVQGVGVTIYRDVRPHSSLHPHQAGAEDGTVTTATTNADGEILTELPGDAYYIAAITDTPDGYNVDQGSGRDFISYASHKAAAEHLRFIVDSTAPYEGDGTYNGMVVQPGETALTVFGHVTDADGNPVSGAAVTIYEDTDRDGHLDDDELPVQSTVTDPTTDVRTSDGTAMTANWQAGDLPGGTAYLVAVAGPNGEPVYGSPQPIYDLADPNDGDDGSGGEPISFAGLTYPVSGATMPNGTHYGSTLDASTIVDPDVSSVGFYVGGLTDANGNDVGQLTVDNLHVQVVDPDTATLVAQTTRASYTFDGGGWTDFDLDLPVDVSSHSRLVATLGFDHDSSATVHVAAGADANDYPGGSRHNCELAFDGSWQCWDAADGTEDLSIRLTNPLGGQAFTYDPDTGQVGNVDDGSTGYTGDTLALTAESATHKGQSSDFSGLPSDQLVAVGFYAGELIDNGTSVGSLTVDDLDVTVWDRDTGAVLAQVNHPSYAFTNDAWHDFQLDGGNPVDVSSASNIVVTMQHSTPNVTVGLAIDHSDPFPGGGRYDCDGFGCVLVEDGDLAVRFTDASMSIATWQPQS